ncbi:MFS transporter [Silicimonas algicola]|uniref:Putative MFS family arabinose efflux permease n=1 Tax=Silicimonas algicola TaxID=1826607 RepID=A0A316GAU5_9RHOB|nr:MFS transporter [Silicimonas algicola]AZQ67449.1 MFS transporter [Silicimonas algicola]PWK57136.1 putative MFS family arabinose efflux permease [Silicimonas algicola]
MTEGTARRWPVISALGVVMIFTWGSTYYLMTVLAAPIAADTGWSLGAITGALSAGLLVAGLASPTVGRAIARHGGRPVLAAGCALIAAGLLVIAIATKLWMFWAGWLVLGLGMAAGLYDPAFASLGRLYGRDARSAITALTLWGGFASAVCWPLSSLMLEAWGWRGVAATYSALHLFGTMPLVLWAIPAADPPGERPPSGAPPPSGLEGRDAQVFGLMAAMLVVNGLIVVNVSTWLFTLLQARGLSLATAVALGALIGPSQVGARVLEMAGRGRHHPIWTLAASVLAIAAGLALLAAGVGVAGAALILYGGGNGLFSIARGALPLAVFGVERYPAVMGRLARPSLVAQAAAPLLGAWVIANAGADAALSTISALAAANVVLLALLWRAVRG